jgi:putative protease
MLESLYIRSELSLGYYLGKNKTRMITLEKPSYNSSDEDLLKNIRAFYLEKKLTIAVNGKIKLHPFEKAELEITCEDAMRKDAMREDAMCEDVVCENEMCKNVTVTATGEAVQAAKSQPLSAEMVNKQIRKTGETDFCFDRLIIDSADPVFVSVKELNTLRRLAISLLEKELLKPYRRKMPESAGKYEAESAGKCEAESAGKCEAESVGKCGTELQETQDAAALRKLHIKIATVEQWESITDDAIMGNSMTCNIITSDAVKDNAIKDNAIANKLSLSISRIYADIDLWKSIISEKTPTLATECYAVLPPVIQSVDAAVFAVYQEIVNHPSCAGVLIGNAEGYEWLNRIGCQKPIVLDYTLYIWNLEAYRFWNGRGASMFYLPPELNSHELKEILAGTEQAGLSVYGRVPMMYSANCVRRNAGACVKASGFSAIVDRYKKRFPVYHDCRQCYNIIYNSVPLSLHEMIKSGRFNEISSYRLDFTTETGPEAKRTIMYFADLLKGRESERPYQDYTTGHFKRGVQ